jgi:hypothetical protein
LTQLSLIVFILGSLSVMQGLKLQQMTLMVAALVALALALLESDHLIMAGIALAFATIKPQLVWLLVVWLMMWTLADFRRRYRFAVSFFLTMFVLWAGSEYYLSHWVPRFIDAMREYPTYTDAVSTFDKLLPPFLAILSRILTVAAVMYLGWKNRRTTPDAPIFSASVSLVLAATITVIPSYALYNQVMLLSALLILLRAWYRLWNRNRINRALLSIVVILILWSSLAAVVLAVLSFVVPDTIVEAAWSLPFWTIVPLPVAVTAVVLVMCFQMTFAPSPRPGPS